MKGLSQGLGLKLRPLSKTFVLVLAVFTKKLRPVLGLNKGLTLRLVGRRLKLVLNMY